MAPDIWAYKLTGNKHFEHPREEADRLVAQSADSDRFGEPWLPLARGERPPGKNAQEGDLFILVVSPGEGVAPYVHSVATVAESTPLDPEERPSAFKRSESGWFIRFSEACRVDEWGRLDEIITDLPEPWDPAEWKKGQDFVRNLTKNPKRSPPARGSALTVDFGEVSQPVEPIEPVSLGVKGSFIGVDLTAGSWESALDAGKKEFPAVELSADGDRLAFVAKRKFKTLTAFREWVDERRPTRLMIDGPCAVRGASLSEARDRWVFADSMAARLAERQLSTDKIPLFWTSRRTLEAFDGASRWIARSLALFGDLERENGIRALETYPNGVFVRLARSHWPGFRLTKKGKLEGRRQRTELLQAYVDGLDGVLRNHDDVDAAAAALVGALVEAGQVDELGAVDEGGIIYLARNP